MIVLPILCIFAILLYLRHLATIKEGAAGSPGTLMQLVAKGQQDIHLTGSYKNHYPYMDWRGYPYKNSKQNPWFWWRQRYPYLRRWHR